jgi:4-hydroxy-3-polyprenylbenzoate decarboxylase
VDIGRWELVEAWEKMLDELKLIPPVYVEHGPVMENVHTGDEVNVLEFPTPKWHELDGGRYIGTGSMDITRDPDEDWVNLGTYRVMIHDEKRVGFYISPGARSEPCPVAVVVGSDPLLFIASTLEVPYGMSEYAWAGGLRGRPFEVIKGPVTGLPIPAQAEIVLEGFAYPGEEEMEGPFGEWTGYYASSARPEPVIRVCDRGC